MIFLRSKRLSVRCRLHDVYGRIQKTSVFYAVNLRRMLYEVWDFYQRHCTSFQCPQNPTGFVLGFPTFPDIVNERMWTLIPHPQISGHRSQIRKISGSDDLGHTSTSYLGFRFFRSQSPYGLRWLFRLQNLFSPMNYVFWICNRSLTIPSWPW